MPRRAAIAFDRSAGAPATLAADGASWPAPQHGGDRRRLAERAGVAPEDLLDASASINPLGPPPWLRQELEAAISDLVHYPDPECLELRRAWAGAWGVPLATLWAGNGSSELLAALPAAWGARRALLPLPCYGEYARACDAAGCAVVPLPLAEADGFAIEPAAVAAAAQRHGCDLVILGSPANPAGTAMDPAALRAAASEHPGLRWLIDEAFIELALAPSLLPERPPQAAVLRSLTKSHACPGLRLGLVAAEAELIAALRRRLPPWSVNHLAQRVGARAAADRDYLARSRAAVAAWRRELAEGLRRLGATVIDGAANFLLWRLADGDGRALAERLLRRHAVAVRSCADFPGLDARWLRTAVLAPEGRERLLAALAAELGAPALPRRRRTPALMVQGTGSHAGKSLLVTALCRIFLDEGLRVCPFKAQNMANNSAVTADGRELGRAQAVQARAARLEPDARMNPVLLKPTGATGSQIVVLGRPAGQATAAEYFSAWRERLRPLVQRAYDELAAEHELMLIEGAGSPGEVNLKAHDLVNMAMARHAGARVLLIGDIDRGGLYASFVGHLAVMEEWERALVAGFVVNRFRGDARLLAGAHDYVLRHTGKPVLGVIPWLGELGLPEEDSLALEETAARAGELDLACLALPSISNFTDLDPLRGEPDAGLRWVRRAEELGRPDALIIPGSKHTLADLAWLHERGFALAIRGLAASGCEVVGLCGGLQMLGERIEDPEAVEGAGGTAAGLGLLPIATRFAPDKTLGRCRARHLPSGLTVQGYEIHHGVSEMPEPLTVLRRDDGIALGCRAASGAVWGTYLHGIFDDDAFRRWWLDGLRARRGLAPLGRIVAPYDLDRAIERVAAAVRAALDMAAVRRLAGLG